MLRVLLLVLSLMYCGTAAPRALGVRTRGGGRIIGGTPADIADYPWMASFQRVGWHYCGASIISSNWVLTAGHCLQGLNIAIVSVRAGTSIRESGGVVLMASSGAVHESFSTLTADYDIGVIQVDGSFPIGSNVDIVDLPAQGYDPPGGLAVTVTGWGSTANVGPSASSLLKVDISVIDRASCVARFEATDRMICAGEAGKSTCSGDSGGPLVSGTTQVGIVSWGRDNCETDGGVYANVGNLRSWITTAAGV
ncbi:trypsin alpha-like [Schistocerca americana]|uniref:trypsin alpha-like n=1 Tax=Schistocerca americana TaxID=7009 RepID=UPI001F4F19DA|nr:trypsin alpha-like [Schistocerca americana]